jgi:hypothetical protein
MASVVVMVKEKGLPLVVVGVPEIAPVLLLRLRPVGRLPEVIAKVSGLTPLMTCMV